MGLYTQISNSSDSAKDVARYNRMNGVSGHTLLGVTLSTKAPQIATTLIGKILNGSAKADNDGKGGKADDDTTRKELNKKLNKALNKLGASDQNDINEAVTRVQNTRDEKINAAQTALNSNAAALENKNNELAQLKSTNGQTGDDGVIINNDDKIKALESEIKELEKKQEKLQKELTKVTETQNQKVTDACGYAEEALNYLEELNDLNSLGEEDATSVSESTEALNEFATQRNILNSKTESLSKKQEAAKKIKELYEQNTSNSTLLMGYASIQKQVEDIIEGENLDKYKNMDSSTTKTSSFGL